MKNIVKLDLLVFNSNLVINIQLLTSSFNVNDMLMNTYHEVERNVDIRPF